MDANLHAHIAALYLQDRIAEADSARSGRAVQARRRWFSRKVKPEVAADLKLPVAAKSPSITPS